MPRPNKQNLTERTSRVYAVRLPTVLADAVDAACGGSDGFPEWIRQVLAAAVGKGPKGRSEVLLAGYEEGKRQGWAHANKVFREALGVAAEKLK